LARLKEFARYILGHIYASVLGDRAVLTNAAFLATLDLQQTTFDPDRMASQYRLYAGAAVQQPWNLNPFALSHFIVEQPPPPPVRGSRLGVFAKADGASAQS
jgi:hypothetical protein